MKTNLFVILLLVSANTLFAQEKKETGSIIEQQLENEIEQGDNPIEDDLYWQQLEYYQKHPVNINTVEEEQLRSLNLLTEIQIASIMRYRKFLGVLLNIYELQAIPGLDILTIKKILPFITVRSETGIKELVAGAWYSGEHSFMTRITRAFHEQADKDRKSVV